MPQTFTTQRHMSSTVCLLNKQLARMLLKNQTFLSKVRNAYCGPSDGAGISFSGFMNLVKVRILAVVGR